MGTNSENIFLDPKLSINNLDLYWVKKSILNSIGHSIQEFEGTLLDVGCGQQPYRQLLTSPPSRVVKYLGMDLPGTPYDGADAKLPDIQWDGKIIPLDDESIDTVVATEVLEHCPNPSVVLKEIYRVLRVRGRLFMTVPFLWPLHDVPHDYYRYTPFALERLLNDVGFLQTNIEALGGWDASLAQMISLWIIRRPISSTRTKIIRRVIAAGCIPVVKFLYKKDRIPRHFDTSPMITGISCIAVK